MHAGLLEEFTVRGDRGVLPAHLGHQPVWPYIVAYPCSGCVLAHALFQSFQFGIDRGFSSILCSYRIRRSRSLPVLLS